MAKRKKLDAAAVAAAQDKAAQLIVEAQAQIEETTAPEPVAGAEDAGRAFYMADLTSERVAAQIVKDVPALANPALTAKSSDDCVVKFRLGALKGYSLKMGPLWLTRNERGEYAATFAAERPKNGASELLDLVALCALDKSALHKLGKDAPGRKAALAPVIEKAKDATRKKFDRFYAAVHGEAGAGRGTSSNKDVETRLAEIVAKLRTLAKKVENGEITKERAGDILLAVKHLAPPKAKETKKEADAA